MDHVAYYAAGPTVGIRSWTRRDRHALAHWPAPAIPPHWRNSGPVEAAQRISFAVDALPASQLIGRITLTPRGLVARLGIYLHSEWCGQGYGSAALLVFQRMQARAGVELLILDVAADNARAIRAYQRAGWQPTDELIRGDHRYVCMQVRTDASGLIGPVDTVISHFDR